MLGIARKLNNFERLETNGGRKPCETRSDLEICKIIQGWTCNGRHAVLPLRLQDSLVGLPLKIF